MTFAWRGGLQPEPSDAAEARSAHRFVLRLLAGVERRPVRQVLPTCALAIALIATLDHGTGRDGLFTLLYLLPVAVASWTGGFLPGAAAALASALTSAWIHHAASSGPVVLRLWNALSELVIFLGAADLLDALHARLRLEVRHAHTDVLTALPNRRAFLGVAEHELERQRRAVRPLTLALLDLDDFKMVNDRLGHATGDLVLASLAELLRQRLRRVDLAARLGGDEFALLLPETGTEQARTVLTAMRTRFDELVRERRWPVGLSVGAVTFLQAPRDVEEALRLADDQLYAAKRAGKGCLLHDTRGGE
jgi:diguanylate cyclase (GGDEF)-like protein